jgi:hypothetical protein
VAHLFGVPLSTLHFVSFLSLSWVLSSYKVWHGFIIKKGRKERRQRG